MATVQLYWNDTCHVGIIGGVKVNILAHLNEEDDPDQSTDPLSGHAVIYRQEGTEALMLLRWSVGASVELPTNNIIHAKNTVLALMRMEENDEQ